MNRILIVNVNWLGDTIFVTPLIKALRNNCPGSYIAVLTHPRCREVIESNPYINEIIDYDEKKDHKNLVSKFSIVSILRSKKFDTAFILRRSLSRNMLLFFSGIPERIGYETKKAGFLLTKKIPLPSKKTHRARHFLNLAAGAGIKCEDPKCEFFVSEQGRAKALELLKKEGIGKEDRFIVMNPGGNWDLKRWPPENFAELGEAISGKLNVRVVLTGAVKDIELCGRIASAMKNKPVLLCGKTDLNTLGAVFERAECVVSNDSGPMHIAASVNASVIALFGPTSPEITGPCGTGICRILIKDTGCEIPCYNLSCKDNKCMKAITVENVIDAIVGVNILRANEHSE